MSSSAAETSFLRSGATWDVWGCGGFTRSCTNEFCFVHTKLTPNPLRSHLEYFTEEIMHVDGSVSLCKTGSEVSCLLAWFSQPKPRPKAWEVLRLLLLLSQITLPQRLIIRQTLCVYLKDSEINNTALHADKNQRITRGCCSELFETCLSCCWVFRESQSSGFTKEGAILNESSWPYGLVLLQQRIGFYNFFYVHACACSYLISIFCWRISH